ncbi:MULTISPECIES: AI-2E family transporter [unclassified Paracoccus (in: a-proteobacteria)]|uniref:AI-2E family transporter n=1 Tax=unclassified Paracoccus (in: a-proteobacteria) TaxID=2688777 RepID=UPI0012B30519|nr:MULTISPECIES: AI-2E family transporter [unclassified Paracoccus (in: a-proteobacteria)]UXU73884.1 AI-2E family transporter [Paracoccus sp. SMMA_5]UXU79772.1 AI-2E family transporter [Paracoccus sp. SMMA_5_TC]
MTGGDRQLAERLQTGFLGVIAFGLVLALLVQARFILICLVFAIIIFSLTSDAISAFARLRVPNWLATALALLAIGIGLLWAATAVVAQINEVVSTSISYADRAQAALARLSQRWGPQVQEAIGTFLGNIDFAGWLRSAAAQASNLISGSVLTLTFVGFMFSERVWFPIKIERLTRNPDDARQILETIHRIMRRVNRYLVVKAAISAVTAALIWTIFRLWGLELAGAVAMLTFVLNFIPALGSIIATVLSVAMVLAQTGDPTTTLAVGGAVAGVQFVIGNILDPMLLGQTLRLSSFGIVLSLAFWGAVWGIAGTFLAVPIMVGVMIVCAQIPWLRPVAIMLSQEGVPEADPPGPARG